MLLRLVLAELRHRPGRALFLLAGYALGVAVMVVLLAVGEAMLEQARDRTLVGGGDLVVVPAGISAEMLKAGGATSLFFGIDQARFVQRGILESPRGHDEFGIQAASPVLDGRLVRLRAGGRDFQTLATGEIPSRAAAAGAAPDLVAGAWNDSEADRRWAYPAPDELYRQLDRFHLPPPEAAGDSTWAEWHYFNVVLDDQRWLYLTFMVGGRVGVRGEWGARILLTVREPGGEHRSLTRDFPDPAVRFDTATPDLRLGDAGWVLQEDGRYRVHAEVEGARIDLRVDPAPNRYFPPTELGSGGLVSGYTVPALFARASGTVCLPRSAAPDARPGCEPVRGAQAYHDHNWGVWRNVAWEWGAASNPELSLLYGAVRGDSTADAGIFAYLADNAGVRGLFRPREVQVTEWQALQVGDAPLRVPRRLALEDARRGIQVQIEVQAAHVTDMQRPRERFFVQMRGVATVQEPGRPPARLPGFFETYVDR